MTEGVSDRIAERLEEVGLWRRAMARWLVVMLLPEMTEAQREWVRKRRLYCNLQILPSLGPEKLDISDVARAANETQTRMGIARPNGVSFRQYPEEGKRAKKM
ncbi:PerC family transcriptional regulator [Enterobacter mori]|uniref:PerC family transcriptional regulator n=1 Tax=Enterobacter mori TaxID=539813 RepID=UPI002ED3D50D|nr:PerC family transcriptional regulator [Enterobacter mori]